MHQNKLPCNSIYFKKWYQLSVPTILKIYKCSFEVYMLSNFKNSYTTRFSSAGLLQDPLYSIRCMVTVFSHSKVKHCVCTNLLNWITYMLCPIACLLFYTLIFLQLLQTEMSTLTFHTRCLHDSKQVG